MRYREIYYTVRKLLDDVPDYRWEWGGIYPGGRYALDPAAVWFWADTGLSFPGSSGPPSRLTHLHRRIRIGQYYTDDDIAAALNAALNGLVHILWQAQELDWLSSLFSALGDFNQAAQYVLEDGEPATLYWAVLPSDFLYPLRYRVGTMSYSFSVQGSTTSIAMMVSGAGDFVGGVGCAVDDFNNVLGGLVAYVWVRGANVPVMLEYLRRPTPFVGTADYEGDNYNLEHPDRFDSRVYHAVAYEAAAILRSADETSETDVLMHQVGWLAARQLLGERLTVGREAET